MCQLMPDLRDFHNGYDAAVIANEFLRLAKNEGKILTNMQLQKLPYIAHGWSLALRRRPLINQQLKVWHYGPVYEDLYQALKIYGASPITDYIYDNGWNPYVGQLYGSEFSPGNRVTAPLTKDDHQLIDAVWDAYKQYDAFQLSALTHKKDTPWYIIKNSKGEGEYIDNDTIKKHYDELAKR